MGLAELRAASREAWALDVHHPNRLQRINTADSHYIPALEAEVARLRAALDDDERVDQ